MLIEKINLFDLDNLIKLQPDGWSDIRKEFQFYLENSFCNPVKVFMDNQLVGLGCSIVFEKSAWIAHIIVQTDYRNKGIGTTIVQFLIDDLKKLKIPSILLIATEIGEPVYKKLGFRDVCDYIFFKREKPWIDIPLSPKIQKYNSAYKNDILSLDQKVTSENRQQLLIKKIEDSFLYLDNDELIGFYIPRIADGPIIATKENAGLELMKLKYSNIDKAVLPAPNETGINFLLQNGFTVSPTKGKRMILGDEIAWNPQDIYSRIGGNFG